MSWNDLYGMLPQYEGVADLGARAQEINAAAAVGDISAEEQQALLKDLVYAYVVIDEAQRHEHKMFVDQLVVVLSKVPLPS